MSETHEHDWLEDTSWQDAERYYFCTGCGREKREVRDRMKRLPPHDRQMTNPGRDRS